MSATRLAAPQTEIKCKIHPLAALFPPMPPDEFKKLKADIELHGQLEPIMLSADGATLLDGRNRLRACRELGITPMITRFKLEKFYEAIKGMPALAAKRCTESEYIWSHNVLRRHLTDDQRAALAIKWSDAEKEAAKQRMMAGVKPSGDSTQGSGRAFLYQAAKILHNVEKPIVILYCGDHDPAGLDIERAARKGNDKQGADRREGLEDILIKNFDWTPKRFAKQVKWLRVAVTEEDLNNPKFAKYILSVKQTRVDPETKEKKKGDSRAKPYIKKYRNRCLEIEALEADERDRGLLANRLDKAIQKYGVNVAAWKRSQETQEREKKEWTG